MIIDDLGEIEVSTLLSREMGGGQCYEHFCSLCLDSPLPQPANGTSLLLQVTKSIIRLGRLSFCNLLTI